jgi:hypothetical protein
VGGLGERKDREDSSLNLYLHMWSHHQATPNHFAKFPSMETVRLGWVLDPWNGSYYYLKPEDNGHNV